MYAVPTVRVVNPAAPDQFMIINQADLSDGHELWEAAPVGSDLRVGKGPRGKWYVWLGRERGDGPFETEADAQTALNAKNGG